MIRRLAPLLLLFSFHTQAAPHPWHYIKTHKELLVNDAIVLGVFYADAKSSTHCQHVGGQFCVEKNPTLGPHPSNLATYGYDMGFAAFFIADDHLAWHYAPSARWRHIIWTSTATLVAFDIPNVNNNNQAADKAACKRSGICR